MKRNEEIRMELKESRLYLYELAMAAGISEPTVVRWLRTPLNDEHYGRLKHALDKLKEGVRNGYSNIK